MVIYFVAKLTLMHIIITNVPLYLKKMFTSFSSVT